MEAPWHGRSYAPVRVQAAGGPLRGIYAGSGAPQGAAHPCVGPDQTSRTTATPARSWNQGSLTVAPGQPTPQVTCHGCPDDTASQADSAGSIPVTRSTPKAQ